MVRIPKSSSVGAQPQALSKQSGRSIGFHPFRWMSRTIRLLIFLLFFSILVGVLWLFVASGAVRVPGLTELWYDVPQPTRIVAPDGEAMSLDDRLNLSFTSIDLVVTEEELTSSIRSSQDDIDQIVITDGGIEYLWSFGPKGRMILFFTADLHAQNGIQFDVESMHVSSVPIPGFLHKTIATSALATTFGTNWLLLNTIEDVTIREGEIQLTKKVF